MVRKIKFKKSNERIQEKGISLDILPIRDYNFLEKNIITTITGTTFKQEGLIGIKKEISNDVIYKIPIIKIIIELLELLEEQGEIKLTKIGNLPPRFVKRLYENSIIKEDFIESGMRTLRNENDVEIIKTAGALCELARYIKKRKGHISLTLLGKKMLKNKYKLLENTIEVYTNKFNWGYFGYSQEYYHLDEVFSYILYLLDSGNKYNSKEFTEELIRAYPKLLDGIKVDVFEIFDKKNTLSNAFSKRCIKGILNFLGLIDKRNIFLTTKFVKSDIFDEIISFEKLNSLRKENRKKCEKSNAKGLILYYNEDNILKFEKEINYEAIKGFKKKKKDDINKEVVTITEKINFICKKCGKFFDYNVEEVTIDFKTDESKFKKIPICPHCKSENADAVINNDGTEISSSQILMQNMLKKLIEY